MRVRSLYSRWNIKELDTWRRCFRGRGYYFEELSGTCFSKQLSVKCWWFNTRNVKCIACLLNYCWFVAATLERRSSVQTVKMNGKLVAVSSCHWTLSISIFKKRKSSKRLWENGSTQESTWSTVNHEATLIPFCAPDSQVIESSRGFHEI